MEFRPEQHLTAVPPCMRQVARDEPPPSLLAAMRDAPHRGSVVHLQASGKFIVAVIGPEGADGHLIWASIQAVARRKAPGSGDRVIMAGDLPPGLRAAAYPDGPGIAVWVNEAIPARWWDRTKQQAVAAIRGRRWRYRLQFAPLWQKAAVAAAAACAAAAAVALSLPGGVQRWGGSWVSPPPQPPAGARPAAGHGSQHRQPPARHLRVTLATAAPGAAVAAARGRQPGAGTVVPRPDVPAPSPGRTSPPQAQPSPSPSPSSSRPPSPPPSPSPSPPAPSPSPSVTVKGKICVQWLLGICVKWGPGG